ncbi:MAG: L-serine ammonia-lyase, iron-sulfur-dependent, subunit alpha [Armatimonadetes bacterium]|nr:L-serine ammonia-lyase, iron-sulfur-dependent, subunit alpha [Armatimonadota bacterium]
MLVSIFNDVIGPVMRGPSSSHCAAALRIGRLARDLMDADIRDVTVEYDRQGSLPTTHASQGSDMGLFGGLLGWEAADERLPSSRAALLASGVRVSMAVIDAGDPHPNTYRLTLANERERHTLHVVSTGGGMIEAISLDGIPVSMFGDCFETLLWPTGDAAAVADRIGAQVDADAVLVHGCGSDALVEVKGGAFVPDNTVAELRVAGLVREVKRLAPVLPVLTSRTSAVPFTTCEEMLRADAGRDTPLWKLAVAYEAARGGLDEDNVIARMVEIVHIVRRSITLGIAGTEYADRILGSQSGGFARCLEEGRLLDAGALNRAVLYVTALMEVKSSMGVIVAAPTAGACAALPGTVVAVAEAMGLGEEEMAKSLLAAGLIGAFIATRWTFAAEVGGCQAEAGAASCMTAAALVTLAHGTAAQAAAAASMALQSVIGLVCDPVAKRVEAPCLGKNVMAASNAVSCANMALAGFDQVIPLDEAIEAARRVGAQMPRELRCTGLGGLSITPTSIALEQRFASRDT